MVKKINHGKPVTLQSNRFTKAITSCVVCNKEFLYHHSQRRTCSNTCRQQLARYRKQVKDKYWHLKADVEAYEKMLGIEELHDDAYAVLESIMVKIAKALEVAS